MKADVECAFLVLLSCNEGLLIVVKISGDNRAPLTSNRLKWGVNVT